MDQTTDGNLLVQNLIKNEPTLIIAVQAIRKRMSNERELEIQEFINAGGVPLLVNLLSNKNTLVQYESAWALSNIAAGTPAQTVVVVKAGAIPILGDLLLSPEVRSEVDMVEQIVWALGNIGGNSPLETNLIFEQVPHFYQSCEEILQLLGENLGLKRTITWAASNLMRSRGTPSPPRNFQWIALAFFRKLLNEEDDRESLSDVLWGISYVTEEKADDQITAVLQTGCTPQLVNFLYENNLALVTPALRILGNLVTGDNMQTQEVLNAGFLNALLAILQNGEIATSAVEKECCWTLANITAGTQDQLQEVIKSGLFDHLPLLIQKGEQEILKEIAWVLSNATSGLSLEQMETVFDKGNNLLPFIVETLQHFRFDAVLVEVGLNALTNLLRSANLLDQSPHSFAIQLSQCRIDPIELVQLFVENKDPNIQQQSVRLVQLLEDALSDMSVVKPAKRLELQK